MLDARLTLAVGLAVPIAALLFALLGRRIRRWSRLAQEELGEATAIAGEQLQGLPTIKAYADRGRGERAGACARRRPLRRTRARRRVVGDGAGHGGLAGDGARPARGDLVRQPAGGRRRALARRPAGLRAVTPCRRSSRCAGSPTSRGAGSAPSRRRRGCSRSSTCRRERARGGSRAAASAGRAAPSSSPACPLRLPRRRAGARRALVRARRRRDRRRWWRRAAAASRPWRSCCLAFSLPQAGSSCASTASTSPSSTSAALRRSRRRWSSRSPSSFAARWPRTCATVPATSPTARLREAAETVGLESLLRAPAARPGERSQRGRPLAVGGRAPAHRFGSRRAARAGPAGARRGDQRGRQRDRGGDLHRFAPWLAGRTVLVMAHRLATVRRLPRVAGARARPGGRRRRAARRCSAAAPLSASSSPRRSKRPRPAAP